MSDVDFVDFYEVLEVSPNANSYTIERVFRFLAKRFHPDVADSGDVHRFSRIVEAYETLRDPKLRAAYDVELNNQKHQTEELVGESRTAESDTMDRHKMLTLFYAKRKRDMKNPGIGISTLEQAFEMPTEVLEFHLWYFREKGWIMREESGLLSITAEGVDKIEDRILRDAESGPRKITDGALRLPDKSNSGFTGTPVAATS